MEILIFGFIIGILISCIISTNKKIILINKKIKNIDRVEDMMLNQINETLGRVRSFYLDIDDFKHEIDNFEANPPFNTLQQAMPTNSILSMVKAQLDGIEEYLGIKKEFYDTINPSYGPEEQIIERALRNAPKIQRLRYVKADKVKQNTKK